MATENIFEATKEDYNEVLKIYEGKLNEKSAPSVATNYVLEKLKAAGIEVITDKEEFDRILQREEVLQKMATSLSELNELSNSIKNQKEKIDTEKENSNQLSKEEAIVNAYSFESFVSEIQKYQNIFPENAYIKISDLNYKKPPYENFELIIGKSENENLILAYKKENTRDFRFDYEITPIYNISENKFDTDYLKLSTFGIQMSKEVLESAKETLSQKDYIPQIQDSLKEILESLQSRQSDILDNLIKENESRKESLDGKIDRIKELEKKEARKTIDNWLYEAEERASDLWNKDQLQVKKYFLEKGTEERKSIGIIPLEAMSVFEDVEDYHLYADKSYLIDHYINRHYDNRLFENIQNVLENYSNIYFDSEQNSICFMKKYGELADCVFVHNENGKIVLFGSTYNQPEYRLHNDRYKKITPAKKQEQKMSLEGSTPLSHNSNGKAAVAISDVNDNSNISQNANKSTLQKMTGHFSPENLFASNNKENLNSEIDSLTINDVNLQDEFIEISDKTPFIFKECGLGDFPVNMYKQKLARALFLEVEKEGERQTHGHKNEFTDKEVKNVFKNIGNPRYVFNSKQNSKDPSDIHLLAVYDEFDKQGNPMMLSLHFNKNRKEIEANWVTAIYGKRKNILVNDWTQKGYLVYMNDVDIEKAPAEVVTLHMRVSKSASAYRNNIILKSNFVNNLDLFLYAQKGETYGFTFENKIYLNPDIMNSNVAVHEYTHLWDEYTKRTNPELWEKGKDILSKTHLWDEIKNNPDYADIADNDDLLASEVHSRICGEIAQKVLEQIAEKDGEITKDTVVNWDWEVANYIAKEFSAEEIKEISEVKEFFTQPMKDLVNGENILMENKIEKSNQMENKVDDFDFEEARKIVVRDPQTKNYLLVELVESGDGYMTDLFDKNQNFIEHDLFEADSILDAVKISISDYAKDARWGKEEHYEELNNEIIINNFVLKSRDAAKARETEPKYEYGQDIFEATRENYNDVLSFLNQKEELPPAIIEEIIEVKNIIEELKKANSSITEKELKDNKVIIEHFDEIESLATECPFDVTKPSLQNLDLLYAQALSFYTKEADRLIDQSEEEVLDDTLDAETEKEITESDNKLRENFNKTRDVAEKYLDDNADRYLMETYNNIIVRNGELFDFVEAEISEDDDEYRWNNALYVVISEDYNKDILAKFNEEWEVSLNPAEVLYNFIESTKTLYNQAVEDFNKSSDEEIPLGLVHFVEDLNSIDLENGRFTRENLIRAEELRNTRESTKDSQVEVEVKNESIEQPSVTISDSENSSTADLSEYKAKLSHFNPKDKERFTQKLVEYAMDSSAVELPEVEYSRENYNKYFNRGNIESPVESLKMGNNQFEKFNQPDRSNLIAAAYLTLKQPSVVIEKETYDEKSESFKPLHVYGKSFYRVESGNKRVVESVVVFKNAENIVIGSHNNDIDNFVKQIKTADQIIFADKNVSRVITQLNEEVGNHVSVYGINTEPLNKSYNPDKILSTNNEPTFEENYNYAKKIFEGKTSGCADDVFNFEEMYKWEKEVFQSKKADEALLDSVSRMVYDNIDFGELLPQTGNSKYDEFFDTSVRFDFTEKIAGLVLDRKLTSLDEIQQYAKDHNAEAALDVKYDYAEDFFKDKTSDMEDRVRTFNEMREFFEKDFSDKPKEWRLKNIVSKMLSDNIDFGKTSLSSKDFDDLYNVEGYDLRCDLCDDTAKKLVAGSFKTFDNVQKYAETQSKEIVATYLAKDKELQNKIEWVNTKPDYINSIEPGDFLTTLKIGACEVEVLKYEFAEKPNVFILNIYTLGKNDDYAVTSGGTPYGYDEGLTVKYDSSKSFEDFKKKVEKAAIKSIVLAGLGRELVRENIDWNNKEQVEKLMEEKKGENAMAKNTPRKRILITNEEWNALLHLADAAKMDWFYKETHNRKTLDKNTLDDLGTAYLAQNLYKLSGEERKLVNDVFSRAEIKIFNKAEEYKALEKLEEENKVENRNVTSPEFIRKFEDEEVSVTKEERELILNELNPLEMSERLKMMLTVSQKFENADEKLRSFILTPENSDEGDIDAGEFKSLLNKNKQPGQPEISEEQAECMMRYLRFNNFAVYIDQKDKFHVVDFSEDFTGEPGELEDTEGIVNIVLDEITLDHGDGTEESYEHQKVLTPLIRHYSYEPALTSDIMQYLKTDDKNLARELEEWKGGFTDDNDFDVAIKYSHLLKDKFGNLALESGGEIHEYTPDAICDLVISDYNAKIRYDKTLDDVDRDKLEESINKLREVRADLRQVSWEQIENLFEPVITKRDIRSIRTDIEEDPEITLTEREVKEETVARLLNENTIDLRGFHTDSNSKINELQFDSEFMKSKNGELYFRIEGEKWNILEKLAETIVQAKDTIDNISLDKQVQGIYDNEVMKNATYRKCVKEGIIKGDFYLSKLIDPALKEAMDILPGDEHDTTSAKLLESAIKSIEDEYNREGVEPDFEQLETLIKGQDAVNYGIKSIDMIRPTAEEIEIGLDNDWDLKEAIKGYTKTGSNELLDGVEVVERIDVMGTFDSDYEAASQAKKDGISMLPINDYERNLDEISKSYVGLFTDTPTNREFLKVREKSVERDVSGRDKDIFNKFISDVKKEYRELKLFRQATINVLKNLPEEERESVNRELKKRGATNENSLASVMKDAVREQLKSGKQKENERKHKKDSDYGYER